MKTLVIAPHPDDELLGCGGTLLRRTAEGHQVGWVLMTSITAAAGWSQERINQRFDEILRVRDGLDIHSDNLYQLGFPTAELDQIPINSIINKLSKVFKTFEPNEVLLPHPGDAHTDHRITYQTASACTKWFRYPYIKRVMTYETLSETDFGLEQVAGGFRPTCFVNIERYLECKLSLLSIYKSELQQPPFPRNMQSTKAQALLRGAQMGSRSTAAEAFQILREFE